MNIFCIQEEFLIAKHMETGCLELVRVAHITGYEIRDSAPAIRDKIVPIYHDHP